MLVQVLIIVALVAIALFLMTLKNAMPQTETVLPPSAPTDMGSTSNELNNVNVDQIDSGLNQLNTDTSTF